VQCPLSGIWSNALNDDFDWLINKGPSGTPQTGPSDDVPGGGNYIYIETSGSLCRSGKEAHLVSNCIEVHANSDTCDLSFNYILNGVHVNNLSLQASLDGGKNWTTLWQAAGNLGTEWRKKFIDLSSYDGTIVQFRFVAKGGNGFRGDIAIDNIVFYGSVDLGKAPFKYYLDSDGDGFGTPDVFVTSCQPTSFSGYVANSGDCDDESFLIHPGMDETPCDGIDFNCNGMDDEFFLLPPAASGDSICNGSIASVTAVPAFGGEIRWFDQETGGNLLHKGTVFYPSTLPENLSSVPLTLTYYAEEVLFDSCISSIRTPVQIVILPQPEISITDTPEGCAGEPFDLATVNVIDVRNANGTLSYFNQFPLVAGNQIDPVIHPTATSTYFIKSTTAFGCIDSASVLFTVLPSPIAVIFGDSNLCFQTSGSLTAIDAGNGVLPLSYQWNTGDSVFTINVTSNLLSGKTDLYAVTITASNGCTSIDEIDVQTVASVDTVETMVTPVSSCDGSDGSIVITPLDGVPPFTYRWSGGVTGQVNDLPGALTLTHLAQTTFAITITDSSPQGCEFVLPAVVVNGPSAIIESKKVTGVSCFGASDGCIELNVIGTSPDIKWSTGEVGEKICNLPSGNYAVTVVDGDCSNVLEFFVPQPPELLVHPTVQDVSCPGKNDGSILLNVFGGSPPYQYSWSHGISTPFTGNLASGFYSVTITDKKNCQIVLVNIAVKQPAPLSIQTIQSKQPGCFGGSDGSIQVAGAGGTKPYSFAWGNGGSGNTLTNLSAGNFTVTVTDAKGCTYSTTLSLSEPPPLNVQVGNITKPSCNGVEDGSISISVTGGSGGYTYDWNNGTSYANLTNVGAGCYQVTVSDMKGCTATSDSLKITGVETLQVFIDKQNPTCVGINNGWIQLFVMNGNNPPYEFYWEDGIPGSPALSNLSPGQYNVTIADANGCISDTSIVLVAPQVLSVSASLIAPACFGDANGQICLSVTQGTQPYQVSWNTGQVGACVSALSPGFYVATVTDANGCKIFKELPYLSAPVPLELTVETVESIACHGGEEGSIDIHVTGGTSPYYFQWSNGSTTEDLKELSAGTYVVTVVDANNCVETSAVIEVSSPAPLNIYAVGIEVSSCQSVQFDSICLEVTGGVAPYIYSWNNGDNGACLVGAPVGDYVVTVTDAAGCTQELMSIKVPESISILSVTQKPTGKEIVCAGNADGALAIVVEGGAKPYQYIWSNGKKGISNDSILILNNLSPADYRVTVTDNFGCTKVSGWLTVSSPPALLVNIPGSQIKHVSCKGGLNGAININVNGGKVPYKFYWEDASGDSIANSEDLTGLKAGHYFLTVTDEMGCSTSTTATVMEPSNILSIQNPAPVVTDVRCFGQDNGKIDISPTGGVPPYTYNWSTGIMTQDPQNLAPGIYQVTITDANACVLIPAPFEIKQPDSELQITNVEILYPSCAGESDGSLDITVSGGSMPYYFNWSPPCVEEDLTNIPAGTYQLTVLDTNLCYFDTSFLVTEPARLKVQATAQPASSGKSDGNITLTVQGGTPPYTFSWTNGTIDSFLLNLPSGWYQVTVTDFHFCDTILWVQVQSLVSTNEWGNLSLDFMLAPNPTAGNVVLLTKSPTPLRIELKVFNSLGQMMLTKKATIREGNYLEIDLSGHPPGIYFVKIESTDKRTFSRKLILR
jgi:hypothetical protein